MILIKCRNVHYEGIEVEQNQNSQIGMIWPNEYLSLVFPYVLFDVFFYIVVK